MLGRIDEADAMLGSTQRGLSGLHALEDAPFAFFTEYLIVPKNFGDGAHQRLTLMGSELITQDDEARLGIGLDQSRYVFNKVSFGPGIGNRWGNEFAGSEVDIAGQYLYAMSDVVELSAFHFACLGRQGCPVPLKSLYARFFVNADHVGACSFVLGLRFGVQFADLLYPLCKLIPVCNVGMFPIPTAMRLECGVL